MSNLLQFTAGGIKSIQRGEIAINSVSSQTVTISAVVPGRTELRNLGSTTNAGSAESIARVALTNATTITATRSGSTGVTTTGWELTEYY